MIYPCTSKYYSQGLAQGCYTIRHKTSSARKQSVFLEINSPKCSLACVSFFTTKSNQKLTFCVELMTVTETRQSSFTRTGLQPTEVVIRGCMNSTLHCTHLSEVRCFRRSWMAAMVASSIVISPRVSPTTSVSHMLSLSFMNDTSSLKCPASHHSIRHEIAII